MEIREIAVTGVTDAEVGWKETLVMPVGDVQLGSGATATDRFLRHIEWGVKHGAYFLGMGDYVDVASPSNRTALRSVSLYDSVRSALEERAQQEVDSFRGLVEGSEGRWLGLLEGHHYFPFADGTTSDTRIAQALGAPFLGSCAFVRLRMSKGAHLTCTIWAHHGAGSGASSGAPLLKLENMVKYFDADVYLMAHMHKKVSTALDYVYMTRGRRPQRLAHRTRVLAGTGGFLEGYSQGSKSLAGKPEGSYVEKAMMGPVALGGPLIKIRPVKEGGTWRLDLGVEL